MSFHESPLVSILIPCYNHGNYIIEAIESVKQNVRDYPVEIIIVNDGSTERLTIDVLTELKDSGYCVIEQENQGLPAARNHAIARSRGKYIIPLDSDNKLHMNYLNKAIKILESEASIDIIYSNQQTFGESTEVWKPGEINLSRMIEMNYIDACAVIRKDIWLKTGGYDDSMKTGLEDWEFWINSYLCGAKFYYLDDTGFYYRYRKGSMLRTIANPNMEEIRRYIYLKHHLKLVNALAQQASRYHNTFNYLEKHRFKSIIKLLLGYSI
jgi:glycosyltransferase involved in cell wall biosynthesis